jgi:WD40 repeat protein
MRIKNQQIKVFLFACLTIPFVLLFDSLSIEAQQLPLTSLPYVEMTRPDLGDIYAVDWHPDGQVLAVATENGLWLFDSSLEEIGQLIGHTDAVYWVDWNEAGTRLASASKDTTVRIWNTVDTSPTYGTTIQTLHDSDQITFVGWAPLVNDNRLVTTTISEIFESSEGATVTQTIRIWNADSGQIEHQLGEVTRGAFEVVWSPDSSSVTASGLVTNLGFVVSTWNAQTGQIMGTSNPFLERIISMSWRPNTNTITLADANARIFFVDASNFQRQALLNYSTYSLFTLDWDSSGDQFAIGDRRGNILVLDGATGQDLVRLENNPGFIGQVVWSPTDTEIASISAYSNIRIWDVSNLPTVTGTPTLTPYPTFIPSATPIPWLTPTPVNKLALSMETSTNDFLTTA